MSSWPLLNLPAELRIAIVKHVLGGNVLHIGLPGRRDGQALERMVNRCVVSESDAERLAGRNDNQRRQTRVMTRHHEACKTSGALSDRMAITLVNRELSEQGMSVLLNENVFTFSSRHAIRRFTSHLPMCKHKFVRRVRIYDLDMEHQFFWADGPADTRLLRLLPGLRHISVFVGLDKVKIDRQRIKDDRNQGSCLEDIELQDQLVSYLDCFCQLDLSTAEVLIAPPIHCQAIPAEYRAGTAIIRVWAERTEKRLLNLA